MLRNPNHKSHFSRTKVVGRRRGIRGRATSGKVLIQSGEKVLQPRSYDKEVLKRPLGSASAKALSKRPPNGGVWARNADMSQGEGF